MSTLYPLRNDRRLDDPFPCCASDDEHRGCVKGAVLSNGTRFHVHRDELRVVYQPIVRCHSLEVFAYEALVRCSVPRLANPEALFQHASRARCCGELGRLIRSLAVPHCPSHALFLNIHPQELMQRWLVRPDDPMYFHDRRIFLEITESMPFDDFDLCWRVLRDVRSRANAHLVIDDLGVGYSNLGRLTQLAPDVVKLDRALIVNLARDSQKRKLVAGLVRLCKDLGQMVVAEGVETLEEFDAICETEADFAQGYFFGRPAFPPPSLAWPLGSSTLMANEASARAASLPALHHRSRSARVGGTP